MLFQTLLVTFLLSISPFGEARAGIPYAVLNDAHYFVAFIVATVANILVYPLFMWLIDRCNESFWNIRLYKKAVVWLSRMAQRSAGSNIRKHGFWGLMVFVMIPLPGTGAYMGTIAAAIFKIERRQAFLAISLGVLISCIIMAVVSQLGHLGLQAL